MPLSQDEISKFNKAGLNTTNAGKTLTLLQVKGLLDLLKELEKDDRRLFEKLKDDILKANRGMRRNPRLLARDIVHRDEKNKAFDKLRLKAHISERELIAVVTLMISVYRNVHEKPGYQGSVYAGELSKTSLNEMDATVSAGTLNQLEFMLA